MKKYHVLFDGRNVWTINDQPHTFDSPESAALELFAHFDDMQDEGIDYEPTDYRIEEIVK